MRAGRRRCLVTFFERTGALDSYHYPVGEVLWKTLWGDMMPERGAELEIAGGRDIQTYLWVSFDYLDLCEGVTPKLPPPQRLGAMRVEYEGDSFDIDAIKADMVNRRDVVLRLVQKSGGN